MFTGIVEAVARVRAVRRTPAGRRIHVELPFDATPGESIAVSGVCLTWTGAGPALRSRTRRYSSGGDGEGGFDAIPETLARTTLGRLKPGDRVNLERSLRAGDRLGGHFVMGHVDAVGDVTSVTRAKKAVVLGVRVPAAFSRYLAPKGSVAIDGVSLTVVDVEADGFTVALIPFTLAHTTLGRARKGTRVNLEADVLARYARRGGSITRAFLQRAGFA